MNKEFEEVMGAQSQPSADWLNVSTAMPVGWIGRNWG